MSGRVGRLCGLAAAGLVTALHAGCGQLAGFEEFERGPLDASPVHRCDPLPLAKADELGLVTQILVKGASGRCLWIDKTEVTVAQYQKFASGSPAFSGWDSKRCAWKGEPSKPYANSADSCVSALNADLQPFGPDRPIRCVDWCDARAFCSWAGKDLCLDGFNYTNMEPQPATPDWSTACSPGSPLPYGDTPQKNACNIGMSNADCLLKLSTPCRAANVGTFADCTFAGGPLDMIGNVTEWIFSCAAVSDGGAESVCQTRGGAYSNALDSVACATFKGGALRVDTRRPDLGFRCCDELTPAEQQFVQD